MNRGRIGREVCGPDERDAKINGTAELLFYSDTKWATAYSVVPEKCVAATAQSQLPLQAPRAKSEYVRQKRTGRAGTAPTGEELADPAGPERVRCARVP